MQINWSGSRTKKAAHDRRQQALRQAARATAPRLEARDWTVVPNWIMLGEDWLNASHRADAAWEQNIDNHVQRSCQTKRNGLIATATTELTRVLLPHAV